MEEIRKVTLNLKEADCKWLEHVFGDTWMRRMEQHIHNEVEIRRHYNEEPLKMRAPWAY